MLVRDDFGGYTSYDDDLAGVQQCLAHLLRYLDDAHAIDIDVQAWARQVADALRAAIHEINTARAAGRTDLDTELLSRLRRRFDNGVKVGISTNLFRAWHTGNHPGLQLAKRLKRKAHQVWLFTTRFDVPPTNNDSESAIRGFKLAAKVQGCWRTLATLQRRPGGWHGYADPLTRPTTPLRVVRTAMQNGVRHPGRGRSLRSTRRCAGRPASPVGRCSGDDGRSETGPHPAPVTGPGRWPIILRAPGGRIPSRAGAAGIGAPRWTELGRG